MAERSAFSGAQVGDGSRDEQRQQPSLAGDDDVESGDDVPDDAPEQDGETPHESEPVYFTDCIGRSFKFPWANARTSAGLDNLIRAAFLDIDSIYSFVVRGHYYVCLEDGWPIPRELWNLLVKPGMRVIMQLRDAEGAQDDDEEEDESPVSPPSERVKDEDALKPLIIEVSPKPDLVSQERQIITNRASVSNIHPSLTRRNDSFEQSPRKEKRRVYFDERATVDDDSTSTSLSSGSDTPYRVISRPQSRATSRSRTLKTHPNIFSVPSSTSMQSSALLRRRQLSNPRPRVQGTDNERRIRIHSARSYEREEGYIGASLRQTQIRYSEVSSGTGPPQIPHINSELSHGRNQDAGHWV